MARHRTDFNTCMSRQHRRVPDRLDRQAIGRFENSIDNRNCRWTADPNHTATCAPGRSCNRADRVVAVECHDTRYIFEEVRGNPLPYFFRLAFRGFLGPALPFDPSPRGRFSPTPKPGPFESPE